MMAEPQPIPPHSRDAERAVIGACLLRAGALDAVMPILTPDMFYVQEAQYIYEAMIALQAEGGIPPNGYPDFLLVADMLAQRGHPDLAKDKSWVVEYGNAVPSVANAEAYAAVVREKWHQRCLIEAAQHILIDVYSNSPGMYISASERVFKVLSAREDETDKLDNVTTLLEVIASARKGEARANVVPSGIGKLDVVCHGGFRRGELWIVGGRPSSGKSTLAVQLFSNALDKGRRVALFSMEVTREQFLSDLLAHRANVNSQWASPPDENTTEDWERIDAQASALVGTRADSLRAAVIDDSFHLAPATLRAKCHRVALAAPLDLVFVDHLQLMHGDRPKMNEYERVSESSRALKLLAKELNCAVIGMSQLNRQSVGERRAPRLDDLRASGTIEQDADGVILMHETPENARGNTERHDMIVAKQRHGPRRRLEMLFKRAVLRFEPHERSFTDPTDGEAI